MTRRQFVSPFLSFILLLAAFSALADVVYPAWVEVVVDGGKVNVVVNYWPDVDKYGRISVNPDGSFYPNDKFWVSYSVFIVEGLGLESVEAIYDQSAFEIVENSGWGSTSGSALFRVRESAYPGVHKITVMAKTTPETEGTGIRGNVTVTVGGVEVDAHYRAECRLRVLEGANGTTDPQPGDYWCTKGTLVAITAIPDADYELNYWLLDNVYSGLSNPILVYMDKPHTLKPVFIRAYYPLVIEASEGGTTNPPPGNYTYRVGTHVDVEAIPDEGYVFSHWLLDGNYAGSTNKTGVYINAPHVLKAVFSAQNTAEAVALTAVLRQPELEIRNFKWTTWFDLLRGTVCKAGGYLYEKGGLGVAYSDVTVEFRKRNLWTGDTWVVSKIVKTSGSGYFAVEDTCNPLFESFLGAVAWAEKPGYLPTWSLHLHLDPSQASIGVGSSFLVGVRVYLVGRYTSVPVSLFAGNVPPGCGVSFQPETGEVGGATWLQSVMMVNVQPDVPYGPYSFNVTASSGVVSKTASFHFEAVEPTPVPSTAVFIARGVDRDASGLALTLDGVTNVYAQQLPYRANWETLTPHTYNWSSILGSTIDGKRYIFERVEIKKRYAGIATVWVEVVEYDPHFTVALSYVMPNSDGVNSYEKKFALIIRYDGNGPVGNLMQRAVLEDWSWDGCASRFGLSGETTGLTAIPGLSGMSPEDALKNLSEITKLFNLTRGVTFSVVGIDAKTEGTVLKVDGESLTVDNLPKTYEWKENTTHTYSWTTKMPVFRYVDDPRWGTSRLKKFEDESFTFRYAQISIPEIGANLTQQIEKFAEQFGQAFAKKILSPVGQVTMTKVGNKVQGVYSHDKQLTSIAKSVGVDSPLQLYNFQFPVYFFNESRYAKLVFDLDDAVAREAIRLLFNSSLYYKISLLSSMFTPHVFEADFECPLEYYEKKVVATVFKWNSAAKDWAVDYTVRVETIFDVAFNTTEENWFADALSSGEVDRIALKMACEDMYECPPQFFAGMGTFEDVMKRTSAYLYNLNATSGRGYPSVGTLPKSYDAWTEKLKTQEAWWSSPTSTLSTSSVRVAGTSSIMAMEDKACNASAILTVLRPIAPTASSKLTFAINLYRGCSGKVYVYLEGENRTSIHDTTAQTGAWSWITVYPIPFVVRKVGIYAELQEESGSFRVDSLFFTNVNTWEWTERVSIERTVYVNFATDEPFKVYVNLDPNSPLFVNVTSDGPQTSRLTINAVPELGGLDNVTVYLVEMAPGGFSLESLPVDSVVKRKLFTVDLALPEEKLKETPYSSYRGYSSIHGGILGFSGLAEILVFKDSSMRKTPGYDATLLLIEAQNVWGTKFHTFIAVQPWGRTFIGAALDAIFYVLIGILIAVIMIGIVVRLLRESRI